MGLPPTCNHRGYGIGEWHQPTYQMKPQQLRIRLILIPLPSLGAGQAPDDAVEHVYDDAGPEQRGQLQIRHQRPLRSARGAQARREREGDQGLQEVAARLDKY
jgi:hypothetical protein